jgi:hypothetical protein
MAETREKAESPDLNKESRVSEALLLDNFLIQKPQKLRKHSNSTSTGLSSTPLFEPTMMKSFTNMHVASQSPIRALPIEGIQVSPPQTDREKPSVSSLKQLPQSLDEIIDRMSCPAVQATREKPEKVSFRRPTQNP